MKKFIVESCTESYVESCFENATAHLDVRQRKQLAVTGWLAKLYRSNCTLMQRAVRLFFAEQLSNLGAAVQTTEHSIGRETECTKSKLRRTSAINHPAAEKYYTMLKYNQMEVPRLPSDVLARRAQLHFRRCSCFTYALG